MLLSDLVSLSILTAAVRAGKRGLCWTYYDQSLDPGLFDTGNDKVVAIYDYETYPPPSTNSNSGLGFIGMQRSLDCSSSPIADLYSRWQAQGWATVFTLNEPDISGITPNQAAAWYIEYINPLSIKKALPAVTSSLLAGEGLSWVSEMITACAGRCYFDYINLASRNLAGFLHWYGGSFAEFQSYIESAHSQFPNYRLVISEFALQNPSGGQNDQIAFFQDALPFLDSAPYVELYFPFVATSPSLFAANDPSGAAYVGTGSCLYNNDGSLSALGNLIV